MNPIRILILGLAAPLLCRCTGTNRVHEVGGTRMIFASPSLSRAETHLLSRPAFKAEVGGTFHRAFTGTTDSYKENDVAIRPKHPGNLQVEQGGESVLASIAYQVTETDDFFLQAEMARVAGASSSVWLLGYRSVMNPEGFSPFLEGGFGMLDVYVRSVLDMYKEEEALFVFPGNREYLGSDTLAESRFVPFPHIGCGLRAQLGARLYLLAKARTLYVHDAHDVGAGAFLNSAGAEAELAVSLRFSVHAAAELLTNTLPGSRWSESLGMGFTFRP